LVDQFFKYRKRNLGFLSFREIVNRQIKADSLELGLIKTLILYKTSAFRNVLFEDGGRL
jgi:hypothetical protein